MGKLENNKKEKKEALLNTAFELFTSKGINKTSISDIVEQAGVAKGTFYLYFSDKYDIRNKLISHRASNLFHNAEEAMNAMPADSLASFDDRIIFMVNHIIDQLTANKSLLNFISKNLSWGIFKTALTTPKDSSEINFYDIYTNMLHKESCTFKDPEIMIFLIVELVSSTCYSSILYNEPASIDKLKPHIYQTIRHIINDHTVSDPIPLT